MKDGCPVKGRQMAEALNKRKAAGHGMKDILKDILYCRHGRKEHRASRGLVVHIEKRCKLDRCRVRIPPARLS